MKRIMIIAALALMPAHAFADRIAIVSGGLVENVIDAPPGFTVPGKTAIPSRDAGVGDSYIGGEFSKPAKASAPVPQSVTDLQLRLALDKMGLLDAVEAYVDAAPASVKIWWERATTIERKNQMVIDALAALKKSSAEGDALFALAASL